METFERCPRFGSVENVTGKQSGYANVYREGSLLCWGQPLYHVICAKCGTVIRSYVKKPEKLAKS